MIENNFIGIFEKEDNIDFNKLEEIKEKQNSVKKNIILEHSDEEKELISQYSHEYISNLKDHYIADESLFDNLEDLINESEDQELLIKILDSL